MSMIQYNTPIVMECVDMIAQCEAMTNEVHADALALKSASPDHFGGQGSEAFHEDYTRVLTYVDQLREKLGHAKQALGMSMDGMIQKDMLIRSSYGG